MTGQTQLDELVKLSMSKKLLSDPQTQFPTTPVDTAGEKHTYTHTLTHLLAYTTHTQNYHYAFSKITALYVCNDVMFRKSPERPGKTIIMNIATIGE